MIILFIIILIKTENNLNINLKVSGYIKQNFINIENDNNKLPFKLNYDICSIFIYQNKMITIKEKIDNEINNNILETNNHIKFYNLIYQKKTYIYEWKNTDMDYMVIENSFNFNIFSEIKLQDIFSLYILFFIMIIQIIILSINWLKTN